MRRVECDGLKSGPPARDGLIGKDPEWLTEVLPTTLTPTPIPTATPLSLLSDVPSFVLLLARGERGGRGGDGGVGMLVWGERGGKGVTVGWGCLLGAEDDGVRLVT